MSTLRKGGYARIHFGLPEEQIRFFDELTPDQVESVRWHFSASLVFADNYVYAVTRDGKLIPRRVERNPFIE